MKKQHKLALHIFRRDLRTQDNTALIQALKNSERVIPCFIFDTRQVKYNVYKSQNSIQFMLHSLDELNDDLIEHQGKLYFFYGKSEEVVLSLLEHLPIDAIFMNRDYTVFSRKRDEQIYKICMNKQIKFYAHADALLTEPEEVHKKNGEPYTIFTPFYKTAQMFRVENAQQNKHTNYYTKKIPFEVSLMWELIPSPNPNILVKGGRREGLNLLKRISHLKNYEHSRNVPSEAGTSLLSAHNKFGTISIREFYDRVEKIFDRKHTLITELYWRDFFTHIAFHFPHVFSGAFHKKYDQLHWNNDKKMFQAWCQGVTGFPIVDAGMRQLNTCGYMHNRLRMITASFLVKDLHIDWRWGEQYFAQKLVDYDPSLNNGNWQWAASTGCDAQPYFRIFNPWLQQKKFDTECAYIKRWVKELENIDPKIIHHLEKKSLKSIYAKPLVDHKVQASITKSFYKKIL